jgi:N-methylhydantoinase A/oxoprolinase/acetone carboxylase beta subunit
LPPLTLPRHRAEPAMARTPIEVAGIGQAKVIDRSELRANERHDGPLAILDRVATTFVDPGWRVTMDEWGNLRVER